MLVPYYLAILMNSLPPTYTYMRIRQRLFQFRVCATHLQEFISRIFAYRGTTYLPHIGRNIPAPFDKILIFIIFPIRGKTKIFFMTHIRIAINIVALIACILYNNVKRNKLDILFYIKAN